MNNDLNEFMKFFAETAPTIIKTVLPISMLFAAFTGIFKFIQIIMGNDINPKPKSKMEEKPVKPDYYEEIKPYIDDISITATVDNLIEADRQDLLDWYYDNMNNLGE